MTTAWTPQQVAAIAHAPLPTAPLIRRDAAPALLPGIDLWDYWPAQRSDGQVARIADGELFFFLSAPAQPDPDARHGLARIRTLFHRDGRWHDLGPTLPDGFSPGSREWSGSAVVDAAGDALTLHFTAAGRRGEARPSFEQRLFETRARLWISDGLPRLLDWSDPMESVAPDGVLYMRDMTGTGAIGGIKAFRDPFFFRDPDAGVDHLLFTASLARSRSPWNGAIGHAVRRDGAWRLQPPLVTADGLNNELERPHIVVAGRLRYLFWSTQAKVFAAGGPAGPTGLYGMVAEQLSGPWRPLNGTGLVLANPPQAPHQAYSWQALPDGRILSFADMVGATRWPETAPDARAAFGGTPAPTFALTIKGARTQLVP